MADQTYKVTENTDYIYIFIIYVPNIILCLMINLKITFKLTLMKVFFK